jgi:hypothetical protein
MIKLGFSGIAVWAQLATGAGHTWVILTRKRDFGATPVVQTEMAEVAIDGPSIERSQPGMPRSQRRTRRRWQANALRPPARPARRISRGKDPFHSKRSESE